MSQNRKCSSLQENGQRIETNFHRASKPAAVLMYQDFLLKNGLDSHLGRLIFQQAQ